MTKYYVRLGDAPLQSLSQFEIHQQIKAGKVTPETPACEVGATQWTQLGKLLPRLFDPNAEPPDEANAAGAAAEMMGKAGHFIAEHTGEVAGLARLFTRRILVSNFTVEHASPEERKQLESASIPVRSPMAQNFAAWRRAMLWFSGIGLALAGAIQFFGSAKEIFGTDVPTILRILNFAMVALQLGAAALVILAALHWSHLTRSRHNARWGWLVSFFGPLLLFLLPLKALSSNREWIVYMNSQQGREAAMSAAEIDQIANSAEFTTAMGQVMIVTFAVVALIILVPRVFGLFPGIIRACLTLRTLVPESPLPGSVAALITPLYTILMLVVLVIAAQIGSAPLFWGLFGLLLSPIILLKNVRELARPMAPDAMNQHLRAMRIKTAIATSVGILFILAAFGEQWKSIGWDAIFSVFGQLLGNIFLLTVVGADFLLGLMKFSFDQDKAFTGTPLYAAMEQRYADLAQVRLTQLVDDAPAPPPPPPPATSVPL